jgi:hypothetical protein
MEFNLKGKGLFVFSDPGGAKPILSLISILKLKDYLVCSDRKYDFYSDFDIQVYPYKEDDENDLFKSFKPDYLFTATSYTSTIELKFLDYAKERKILSYSFIDHYTNYLSRFYFLNHYIFPDIILVVDNIAHKIACECGLSEESEIMIIGNYYHTFLRNWKPDVSKIDFLKNYNIDDYKQIITFAPDPLSNLGGVNTYGFDEVDVLNCILDSFNSFLNDKNFVLIIKLHPNQNKSKLEISNKGRKFKNIVLADNIHTSSLIYYSDFIVGMYSSFLIESNIFNKKIIRILPNQKFDDSLKGLNIGSICSDTCSFSNLILNNGV